MDNRTNEQTGRATTIKATPLVRDRNSSRPRPPAGSGPRDAIQKIDSGGVVALVDAQGNGVRSEEPMLGCVRKVGTPPAIPERLYRHPTTPEIAALGVDQWFEVPAGTVNPETLKRRVREANRHNEQCGKIARCVCFEHDGGALIVRRMDQPTVKGSA